MYKLDFSEVVGFVSAVLLEVLAMNHCHFSCKMDCSAFVQHQEEVLQGELPDGWCALGSQDGLCGLDVENLTSFTSAANEGLKMRSGDLFLSRKTCS